MTRGTDPTDAGEAAEWLIDRMHNAFTADAPNELWLGDIEGALDR